MTSKLCVICQLDNTTNPDGICDICKADLREMEESGEPMECTPETHDDHWHGISTYNGRTVEIYQCAVCGRLREAPYSGTQDTVEYRNK
jgi:hypothetical protein